MNSILDMLLIDLRRSEREWRTCNLCSHIYRLATWEIERNSSPCWCLSIDMKGISSFSSLLFKEAMKDESLLCSLFLSLILRGGLAIIYVRNWIWVANEIIFHLLFLFSLSLIALSLISGLYCFYFSLILMTFWFRSLLFFIPALVYSLFIVFCVRYDF